MTKVKKLVLTALSPLVGIGAGQSRAAFVITMARSGSDVVISGGGTANLAGFIFLFHRYTARNHSQFSRHLRRFHRLFQHRELRFRQWSHELRDGRPGLGD